MKIAILGPFYPFRGGIAYFLELLAKKMHNMEHEIKVFNFLEQYPDIIFPGKNQYEQNYKHFDFKRERVLTPYNPLTWHKTISAIKKWKPDILILKYWIPFFAPSFGYITKKLKKFTKIVYIIDNIDFHEKWFAADKFTKYAVGNADAIITLSSSVYNDAKRLFPQKKIIPLFHPIYYGYNKNAYTKEKAKEILNIKDKPAILFFGFIKKYKGLKNLIKAFKIIKKDMPQLHLIIAGEVYGDDSEYLNLINDLHLKDVITFHNKYIDESQVELYFKASDLLVLPYIQATQSGILNIAYDMLVPTVATPVGSLPQTIGAPKTGLISKSTEPQDIAQTILQFFNTDSTVFVENIIKEKEKYSWEKFAEHLLKSI